MFWHQMAVGEIIKWLGPMGTWLFESLMSFLNSFMNVEFTNHTVYSEIQHLPQQMKKDYEGLEMGFQI